MMDDSLTQGTASTSEACHFPQESPLVIWSPTCSRWKVFRGGNCGLAKKCDYFLWKFLKPNTPLESRISKQWCEIGFQGDDPKTDFRGMGLLGLYNLQYFAERDAVAAQQVLSDSLHPKCRDITKEEISKFSKAEWEKKRMDKAIGYSFAIVGINITDLAYNLLVSGALKTHFYNIAPEAPTLSHFQQTFCYLMHEFHKFWIEEDPMDIMEFNRVREKFRKRIIRQLQNPDMALCPHFAASEGLINM
ncbi:ELMO domain-containing protein 1 [Leptonychotes weddellii]|uniref:ELMO domain-containing protein 1 n=1 Tax=Leptonychotes weddellii TaxID=9713 RepID=A0A7F8RT44_LEPWE|nr:ELMO domain-containing protein 1 [Leptonychotes weddellii]